MKVRIKIRLTPLRPKARFERVQPFPTTGAVGRAASPLSVWAVSMMLTICFLSVSMFATLSPAAPEQAPSKKVAALTVDEEDPSRPVVGLAAVDCRVMLIQHGRKSCLDAVEYRADNSGRVMLGSTNGE